MLWILDTFTLKARRLKNGSNDERGCGYEMKPDGARLTIDDRD